MVPFALPRKARPWHWILAAALLLPAQAAVSQIHNQVPNPDLRGDQGVPLGNVSGTVPSSWRGFAVGNSALQLTRVPVAAGALYAGSPATNAIRLEVLDFGDPGDDAGFDHSGAEFSLLGSQDYRGAVYLMADNPDASDQAVSVSLPIFDAGGTFTGNQPGSFNATASGSWTRFAGPAFAGIDDFRAMIAFRLLDDGGDDAVLIALPEADGPPLANRVPNLGFDGTGGVVDGMVTGDVPDFWRAFAINGDMDIQIVPLAADVLYPGSPPTRAVALDILDFGDDAGFDHELARVPLAPPGFRTRATMYLRSGNPDASPQGVQVGTPVFDAGGFTGRSPGGFAAVIDDQWRHYAGPTFSELPDTETDIVLRLTDDGGPDRVLIALPQLLGLDLLFVDGFE